MNSSAEVDANLATAERLVRGAAADGAELVVLPEKWNLLGAAEALLEGAETLDGPTLTAASGWARDLGVHLVAGSIPERLPDADKVANTSVLIEPDGEIVAVYRKIHMFDVDVGGVSYRESAHEEAGAEPVLGTAGDVRIGLTVCYDLRFPELYRVLAVEGARVITVPSAFTSVTGAAHWEVLLRARAIEDQVFVIAANQTGKAQPHYDSHGHSMIVDPWGSILAAAGGEECFVGAELDFAEQDRVRESLPSLANRRPAAYRSPAEARG
jgi:predicted amidohydrolase